MYKQDTGLAFENLIKTTKSNRKGGVEMSKKNKGGGGGGQKPKVEISLTESHERSWDKWRVTIIATVKENQKPSENKAVTFMLGNRQIGGLVATDADGKASQSFFLPNGTYIIIAKLQDGTQHDIAIALGSERSKARIVSRQKMEGDGKYNISFQVLANDGKPIADAILRMFAMGESCDLSPTDANGMVELGILLHQKELVCDFVLVGSNPKVSVWKNFFKTNN